MAYRPLLGNGPALEVASTMIITAFGLIAFAAALEGFLLKKLNWFELILMYGAALAMFWPVYWLSGAGVAVFILITGNQWVTVRRIRQD